MRSRSALWKGIGAACRHGNVPWNGGNETGEGFMGTKLRRVSEIVAGYIVGAVLLAWGVFRLVLEAQAREDELNEREMLMGRNWDE